MPHYDLLQQTSLDLQVTRGDWLAKMELVHRDGVEGRSTATVAVGGRLTFNDVQDTNLLAFTAIDTDNGSRFLSVEADRR
ncbi:MAG TPA: hypothetical protein DIC52_21030 [Candidatus Latescibacteria bacterium]|nr:hypothetical protein [Candidatus Latescibacterota bacterium]